MTIRLSAPTMTLTSRRSLRARLDRPTHRQRRQYPVSALAALASATVSLVVATESSLIAVVHAAAPRMTLAHLTPMTSTPPVRLDARALSSVTRRPSKRGSILIENSYE